MRSGTRSGSVTAMTDSGESAFAIQMYVTGRAAPVICRISVEDARQMVLAEDPATPAQVFKPEDPPTTENLKGRWKVRKAFTAVLGEQIRTTKSTSILMYDGASSWAIPMPKIDFIEVVDLAGVPEKPREYRRSAAGFRIPPAPTSGWPISVSSDGD